MLPFLTGPDPDLKFEMPGGGKMFEAHLIASGPFPQAECAPRNDHQAQRALAEAWAQLRTSRSGSETIIRRLSL